MKTGKKLKRILTAVLSAAVVIQPCAAFASVLGSVKINGYTVRVAEGTDFTHNVFYSDQSGVGQQTENYFTYEPGSEVYPTITNGTALYGGSVMSKETARLEGAGLDIVGGTNADFFSLQTGVPMSNAIMDGKILTKDASGQDAIGIMEDGTAFISYFSIASVLKREDGSEVNIYNINKYRQPYAIYLMTSDFSDTTRNFTRGYDVVLGSVEGEMKIGTSLSAVVESVAENTGAISIPKGKIILTVDANAPAEFLDPIAGLKVGEKVSISFGVIGDERWKSVKVGMGSIGGRLLTNGEINSGLAAGAAPRTAIGITENGGIVLYTIDGRQNGYSYGVQLKTLAARMKELGCTDAINLDGGGSTTLYAQFPGDENAEIRNKPSDGRERAVSTFFYFVNKAAKGGAAAHLHMYPLSNYVMKGAKLKLMTTATDAGYHPVTVPAGVEYSVEDGKASTVTADGVFTAGDSGEVRVFATAGDVKTSITVTCLDTPTSVVVKNRADGSRVTALSLEPGKSVELDAEAYGGYNKLVAETSDFGWSADENIGSFEGSRFTVAENYGASGKIYVKAAAKTVEIPVTLKSASASDPDAYPYIELNFDGGKVLGRVSCKKNVAVSAEGISLRADGKKTEFEYNAENGTISATVPENTRKITVYATNVLGYTNCGTLYTGAESKSESPFVDTAGHWAEGILGYMYSTGVVSGESTDLGLKFNPQKQMTRSEFSVMICNYLGVDTEQYASVALPYSDVKEIPAWALNSFKALYSLGIVTGRYVTESERCADPMTSINRAEAATIVARTLPDGFYETTISAPDKTDIPRWAENGVKVLVKLGAMNGYENGRFLPLRSLTKAEAAKILYSVM